MIKLGTYPSGAPLEITEAQWDKICNLVQKLIFFQKVKKISNCLLLPIISEKSTIYFKNRILRLPNLYLAVLLILTCVLTEQNLMNLNLNLKLMLKQYNLK